MGVQRDDSGAVPRPAPAPGPGLGAARRRGPVRWRRMAGGAAGPAHQRLPPRPATQGVLDFRAIDPPWLREVVKDWALATRPYLQRLRETLRACQAASHVLAAAGRTDPASLGAGDFTRILDAIAEQRRVDGSLHSASHRNLMLYQ